ncbi:MAG: hypothetical protein JJE51_11970 [Thermoanaerobaculia bacterium]|nr:hypothetical protein [Thermoanaerobaculia bacterium]
MRRIIIVALLLTVACGSETRPAVQKFSKNPISVRGWIVDVEGAAPAEKTFETEMVRLTQQFQSTSIWVENAQYVSGGVAENGAFILLDVPPGNSTISFNAPGAETARIVLENIPGNADVLIPHVVLKRGGSTLLKPAEIRVRVPARIDAAKPTGAVALVNGHKVPVFDAPLSAFVARRDYPNPGGIRPLATFK